jgi:quinol-cytochrome oxidoreductase complex cytochrome b subunit
MQPEARSRAIRSAAQLCCAILVGVALTVLILELALRGLDRSAYVAVRHAEYDYFTWFIGLVFLPTIVTVVMLVITTYKAHSPLRRPALLALGLIVVAIAITLTVNGPINVEQLSWSTQSPPADWAAVRDRWQIAHAVRTLALILALVALSTPATARRTGHSTGEA